MFSVGIIGLPNAGKSTLFKAITKIAVPVSEVPFTTINPNRGIVEVEDERLNNIQRVVHPQKIKKATIEFVDVAGLVRGAHQGKGLGNQFLSILSEVDLLLEVVRGFRNEKVSHPEGSIDPKRDIEIIKNEILERDKKILENFLAKKMVDEDSKNLAKEMTEIIEREDWLYKKLENFDEEKKFLIKILSKGLGILSMKPIIYLTNEEKIGDLSLNLKDEEEIANLDEGEKEELGVKSSLDKLISFCYNKLDLITFFTIVGGKEIRAWEIKRSTNILDAAEKVHSDFKEKFKKAEVLPFGKLTQAGSWQKAKENGWIKTEGKKYLVQDGDIVEFKI